MGLSAMDLAAQYTDAAERARLADDPAASIALAVRAAEYLQLAKLLGDSIAEANTPEGD